MSVITKAQIGIADAHTGNYEQGIRGLSDAYDHCTGIDLKAQIVLNIVQCRLDAGDHYEAAQEYDLLEELYKQLYGDTAKGSGVLAVLWNDKATLYDKMGDFVSAIDGYETALQYWMSSQDVTELSEAVLSAKGDGELVNILINEAITAIKASGYTSTAQDLIDKALIVCRERFGEDSSETARCYSAVAGFYSMTQDKGHEKLYLDKALEISLNTVGENSALTASIYGSLGQYHAFRGELETAVSYYERAIDIRRNILGYNDLLTASLYEDIAFANDLMLDFKGAIEAGRTAVAICEGLVGKDSPQTADAYIELSRPLINTDQYAEAQELLDRSMTIYQKHLPDGSVDEAFACQYQMKLYQRQGKYEAALAAGKTSLALFQKFQGESHSNTADAEAFLGDAYVLLGDAANAETLYSRAAAVYSDIFSPKAVHNAMDFRIRDLIALEEISTTGMSYQQIDERVSQLSETVTDEQVADRYASWGTTLFVKEAFCGLPV